MDISKVSRHSVAVLKSWTLKYWIADGANYWCELSSFFNHLFANVMTFNGLYCSEFSWPILYVKSVVINEIMMNTMHIKWQLNPASWTIKPYVLILRYLAKHGDMHHHHMHKLLQMLYVYWISFKKWLKKYKQTETIISMRCFNWLQIEDRRVLCFVLSVWFEGYDKDIYSNGFEYPSICQIHLRMDFGCWNAETFASSRISHSKYNKLFISPRIRIRNFTCQLVQLLKTLMVNNIWLFHLKICSLYFLSILCRKSITLPLSFTLFHSLFLSLLEYMYWGIGLCWNVNWNLQ